MTVFQSYPILKDVNTVKSVAIRLCKIIKFIIEKVNIVFLIRL
jgi:hypothetical protein